MPHQLSRSRYGVGLAVLLWALGSGRLAGQAGLQPADWDAGLKLPEAVDINPDPKIVEINLEARLAEVELAPGKRIEAWTYNGTVPGPLIRVRVGDRLIVHFSNKLPKPTTVHWHGLRVPIEMDGVPGISQPEVKPGETFIYDFVVPDAGLFWYHPHVMSAAQVGFGLSGLLLAEDPADTVGVADELVLALNDIGIDETGHLEDPESGGSAGMAFGREGNNVLVNGRWHGHMTARAGVPQRWRVANIAKSRYFSIDLGPGQTFTKIGGDGGLQEYSVDSDYIVLGPGERADLIVTPRAKPGTELALTAQLFDRGYGSTETRSAEALFTMAIANTPAYVAPPRPPVRRVIEPTSTRGRHTRETRARHHAGDGRLVPLFDERRVVPQAVPRQARRNAGLDRNEHDGMVASHAPAWLLLPCAGQERRAGASARVEGHGQRSLQRDRPLCRALR